MRQEIHKGDIGTVFRVTLYDGSNVVDLSGATAKKIIFKKPNAAIVSKDATFTTDGTDGKIEYVSVDGDIDAVGEWSLQATVTLSAGSWASTITSFQVYPNLLDQ